MVRVIISELGIAEVERVTEQVVFGYSKGLSKRLRTTYMTGQLHNSLSFGAAVAARCGDSDV